MNRIVMILLFALGLLFEVTAQQKSFNERYLEVSVSLAATDIKEALRVADSLSAVANNDEQRIKALMLSANLHHYAGNLLPALRKGLKADNIAKATLIPTWQSVTSGFLATTFRKTGLTNTSQRHLVEAEHANEKQKDNANYILTKINIEHEKAMHALDEKDYKKALDHTQAAEKLITFGDDEDARSKLIKASNDQMLGVCNLNLGYIELADSLFKSSLSKIEDDQNRLKPYIYRGLAEVALLKGNDQEAFRLLSLIMPYVLSEGVGDLEATTYATFSKYYWKVKDVEKAIHYDKLSKESDEKKVKAAKEVYEELYTELESSKEEYKKSLKKLGFVALCLSLVLILFFLYLLYLRKVQRRKYELLSHKMAVQKNEKASGGYIVGAISESKPDVETKEINISKETEERLLKGILNYENELFFLEKNIKLGTIASDLNTNIRYISYIIRKHKGRDFYNYIQSLRVQYIIKRIKMDPVLLDYKLSHLADMAGFTSPSKFSVAFKAETGLPPSAFIQLAKKDMKQEGAGAIRV